MEHNIIVVGAGMAGLALSIGLAKLGYSVDLVERRHDLRKRGGATFGLQPNAIKAVQEICPEVMESLKNKGVHIAQSGGIMFMWWIVRDALLEEVAKYQDKVKLWTGWTFSELVDDSSNPFVLAKFTRTEEGWNGDDALGSAMEIKGVMLVGADGVHSAVRSALNLPPAEFAGSVFWRGTIIVPEDSEVLSPLLDKELNPALFAVAGPTILTVFNHNQSFARALCWSMGSKDPEALTKAHPIEVIQPYVDPDDEKLKIFQAAFELADPEETKYAIKCETIKPPDEDGKGWGGKGRVTLLGDSAHAMRPAGGLGAALAYEDCVILIRLLKELDIHTTKDFVTMANLILQFENSRLPRVRKIWDNQWKTAEKNYKQPKMQPDPDELEFYKWVFEGV